MNADAEQNDMQDHEEPEPHGEENPEPEKDWKAECEKAIAHSRKWEERAKANKAAAVELESIKQSQMTDQEKIANYERRIAELEHKSEVEEWKRDIADQYGVPVGTLNGDSREQLDAQAKAIAEFANKRKKPMVIAQGDGKQLPDPTKFIASDDWVRESYNHRKG